MRILWFKPVLPFPPLQGTRRVTLQLLKNLSLHHEIRLFTRLADRSERDQVPALEREVPRMSVVAPLAPNRVSPFHRVWYRLHTRAAAARGIPPVETYTCLPPLLRAFSREAREFAPDLIVSEYWYAASYLHAVTAPARVMFAHDIDYRIQPGAGSRERNRSGAYRALEAAREQEALSKAPFTWFLTPADRDEAVTRLGIEPGRTGIMPFGVELGGRLAPRSPADPPEDPEQVLFFGSFAADFNRDALEFTLAEIWPEIRKRRPGARLMVAGSGLPAGLARRVREAGGVTDPGARDVRRILLPAAVVLVPLRYGGGLRIRLLESLALERAVVGTPSGVLGMGPESGRELLAGGSPRELAEQVVRALEDESLRRELGRAGRAWVTAHHAPDRTALEQRALVEETVERQRKTP